MHGAGLEDVAEWLGVARRAVDRVGTPCSLNRVRPVEAAVLEVNDEARNRSLQVALLIPLLASLLGIGNAYRMLRLPDIKPTSDLDGVDFG